MNDSIISSTSDIVRQTGELLATDSIPVKEKLDLVISDFVPQIIKWGINAGLKLLAAIIIIVVGFWITKKLTKLIVKALEHRNTDRLLCSFLRSICNIVLKITVLIVAVQILGIETMSFAAVLAAVGVGIGMALSGTLQNFAGGIVLLLFKPFKVGDFVECQSFSGTIMQIHIFMTEIKTPDNKIVFVPNSTLISSPLTNYTKEDIRRIDIDFTVAYGTNLKQAKEIIENIAAKESGILCEPATLTFVSSLADSCVVITLRSWTKTEDYWTVKYNMNENVYNAFNEKGIEIPFPQLAVHIQK
ncbi:MAG: mechanosensitive ion channel family protein [Prevotellaceae bacterium]|jgi:small conductance mechanosensitive channel|nr:mechanosensitive ion channel family protein [Prevotellaceae bacterium]